MINDLDPNIVNIIIIVGAVIIIALLATIIILLRKLKKPKKVLTEPSPEMKEILKGWATIES